MEPLAKRPRTGPSPLRQQSKEDEDDELNYEPDEVSRMRDPGFQLEQSRAFAAFKLKSTFEHIFQKYERDFTGIGDEIDLRTGEIITDNGHLSSMRNERDTGIPDENEEDEGMLLEEAFSSGDDEEDNDEEDEDDQEDERMLGKKDATPSSTALTQKAKVDLQSCSSLSHTLPASRPESEQRLSNLGPHQSANGNSSSSANPWGREPESVDPTWRVPEINPQQSDDDLIAKLYGARYRFPVSSGSQSVWASRQDSEQEKAASEPARIDMAQLARARQEASRMARQTSKKVLHVFTTDDDKEDDILGVSTADREFRSEKKKEEKKKKRSGEDAAKDQTKTKPPLPDSAAKEPSRHKPRKSSVGEKLTSKKQLVPAKVRKPRKSAQLTESSNQRGEEHLVDVTARLDSTQGLGSIVTGEEAQKRPRQHIVVEIFSKRPPAHEITEVEDSDDMVILDSAPQDTVEALNLSGLAVSEPVSKSPVPRGSPVEAVPDADASVEATSGKTPAPPKEKFFRHEIDPAYAFSDDDDGIPTTRARASRSQKEPTAIPVTEESTKEVFVAGMRPSEETLPSEISGDRQDSEAQPESGAENGNPSSTAGESADPGLHRHEASQAATNIQPASTSQSSRDILDKHQITEQHVTNEINMAGAENAPSTEDVDMQILELLDEIYQETEAHGNTYEGGWEGGSPLENIREDAQSSDVPVDNAREGVRTDIIQGGDGTEEQRPAGDTLQEEDKEVIEPFIVPLGLDEMDGTSTAETDPEPEAMDFELPILTPLEEAPPPTGALSAMPRRGCLSSAFHSGRLENTATSPMRGLKLQSSSPPERHADPGSSPAADAGGPVWPRASVSPKRETTHETQEAAASRSSPALASQAASPEAADAPESPAVGQASPAPKPPRRKRQPKQPSTPSSRRPRIAAKGSSAKISVISLLSDDEDDEKLTPDLFKTRTPGRGDRLLSGDPGGGSPSTPALPAGPQAKTATPAQQHVPSGGRAGSGASTTSRHRKRMAAWAFATPSKAHLGSPSGSLVRTPGGNLRRCGEEGFRCDRDFCFTCL
ncbi:centromere protein Scm3 [Colletotrichum graminicola]|uniref:Centromere protein Scm3 n=1 Tax=Colletotrichum graminicola (strain M1.001 / M2 / FGSC 10212) TaxID=645133 RepID=E3Q427_COLGM|nr:centromere protein Scm3 [Colletotrichum graminicola M1.001]EFQ25339.1 centromere protein Scm3 [Colletotrichum graminicola M1.001]WDK11425.1 centromere protein Scm3 [Colletotrichum graminicola]